MVSPIAQSDRKKMVKTAVVSADQREMPVFDNGVRKKGDLDSACKVRKSEMKDETITQTEAWNPYNICGSTVTSLLPCSKTPVSPEAPKSHNLNNRAPLILTNINNQNKKVEKIWLEDEE